MKKFLCLYLVKTGKCSFCVCSVSEIMFIFLLLNILDSVAAVNTGYGTFDFV